jgi:hypothetical protein
MYGTMTYILLSNILIYKNRPNIQRSKTAGNFFQQNQSFSVYREVADKFCARNNPPHPHERGEVQLQNMKVRAKGIEKNPVLCIAKLSERPMIA